MNREATRVCDALALLGITSVRNVPPKYWRSCGIAVARVERRKCVAKRWSGMRAASLEGVE